MPESIVYNEDCVAGMKRYPDKYFDLAVVDPPYGIGAANRSGCIGQKKGQGKITNYKKKNWDNLPPDENYFNELFRVSKNQIIWGANYFTPHIPANKTWLVWDKSQPEGVSFAMHELAYTSFNSQSMIFRKSFASNCNKVSNNKALVKNVKIHVNQKPIELYDWIFHHFAVDGNNILDTHLGSGSSRISAYKYGFDFTAFENDKDHYNDQEQRFNDFVKNFDPASSEPVNSIGQIKLF